MIRKFWRVSLGVIGLSQFANATGIDLNTIAAYTTLNASSAKASS
jgi:hypothetical protein